MIVHLYSFHARRCTKSPSQNCHSFFKLKKIQILDWSGNSPDLNAIESLWTILKDKVFERQPTNAKMLEQAIKEVWVREMTTEYCRSHVESMPKRLEAVIIDKGGATKY